MQILEVLRNIMFVLLAAFAGYVFAIIVREKQESGPKLSAILFGVVTLIYLLSPRTKLEVDAEDSFLYVVRKNFVGKQVTACQWRTYDRVGDLRLTGWCAKDKDGNWYRFLRAADE